MMSTEVDLIRLWRLDCEGRGTSELVIKHYENYVREYRRDARPLEAGALDEDPAASLSQPLDYGRLMGPPRHALRRHIPAAIDSITRGFESDPVYEWMFPNPESRPDYVQRIMTMYSEWALQVGNAWILGDGAIGGACWVPADVEPNAEFESTYISAAVEANPDRSDVVIQGLMEVGAVHPEESHWYLAAVSVVPEARGRGLGQVLLAPVLDMLDDEGVPAYLESSNTRNVPFYERLGFETQHQIRLPDGGPVMTTMWRPPSTQ